MREGLVCSTGKLCYGNYSEAQLVVNKANKTNAHSYRNGQRLNRRSKPRPKRVYFCEECGYYHLTSQIKKEAHTRKKVRL